MNCTNKTKIKFEAFIYNNHKYYVTSANEFTNFFKVIL